MVFYIQVCILSHSPQATTLKAGVTSVCYCEVEGRVGPPCWHQPLPWIKSTIKIARCCGSLGDSGFRFLQFFRVVSSDEMANPG